MKSVITCAVALTALVAFASPAKAQQVCAPIINGESQIFPDLCGTVWNDTNHDGLQNDDADMDASNGDSSVVEGAVVTLSFWNGMEWLSTETTTDSEGYYYFDTTDEGLYKIVVTAPTGTEPSPRNFGADDTIDSDAGNSAGNGAIEVVIGGGGAATPDSDFGFQPKTEAPPLNPGTGTPGYWKNHTEVWSGVTIGGRIYTSEQAAALMGKVSKDKTISLFAQLVAAKLNVGIGNDSSCIAAKITEADNWMASNPVGSNVAASSTLWQQAMAQVHKDLDDYNNGRLCAPHRN